MINRISTILLAFFISTPFCLAQEADSLNVKEKNPIIIISNDQSNNGDNRDGASSLKVYLNEQDNAVTLRLYTEDYGILYLTTFSGAILYSEEINGSGTYTLTIPPGIALPYLIVDTRRIYAVYEL